MAVGGYIVRVRDETLKLTGALETFTRLTLNPQHNGVGTYELTLDASAREAPLIVAGGGIVVWQLGVTTPVFNGRHLTFKRSLPVGSRQEILTITGVEDTIVLADAAMYPAPNLASTAQSTVYSDIRTGVASTILRAFVNAEIGPGALVARQVAGLTIGADPVAGASITLAARWDRLIDLVGQACDQAGLGFRVVFVPGTPGGAGTLDFRLFVPTDRTGSIRFTKSAGNLSGYEYLVSAPSSTRAIVAGGGVGTARVIRERASTADEATWKRRIETFVDRRDTTDLPTLDLQGDQTLFDNGATAGLSLTVINTPQTTYGRDYFLGDKVRTVIAGIPVDDVLRQVKITLDAQGGLVIAPVIGTTPADAGQALLRRFGRLTARVLGIEGRQ